MLSPEEVTRHLLSVGLLDARNVLDGDLWIDEVQGRNRSYKIQSRNGPCYFVKQGVDEAGETAVAHEASTYRYLSGFPSNELHRALPRFHGYDEPNRLLILGLSPGSLSLREYHVRRGRIPTATAAATGSALAHLHRIPLPDSTDPSPMRAWPLFLHRPDVRILREASSANLEMIRMIQEFPDYGSLLDGLRAEWNPTSLIHFDLKADNCAIAPSREGRRGYEIRIVDLESAGTGDPCWDVGSIFSDYLGLWLLSIPVVADTPPERFLELTRIPLDRMHPAIRAFWSAYASALGLSSDETREALLLAVRYSAARLLQTGFEQMQLSQRLTGNVVCLLQLSWNILQRPADAADRLLGLTV